jgi:hypothetical protein
VDVTTARVLELVIDELVLDGVEPDDPLIRESVAQALAPSLAAHGYARSTQEVAFAVTSAMTERAAE